MTKPSIATTRLRAVDTGWAWVVAAAAFLSLFFTCGFSYSTGVYYVIFLRTFGEGKGATAGICSLNFGVLCAVGPIASLMIKKINCRFTVFVGGCISSIGLAACGFATDIYTLFFTFGVLTGAGFGLVFTSCVVVISEYFIKYRVVAMGLSISGTGLGTVAYPWLSRYLVAAYGWRGALLLSAGINAHVCVLALLMRPNHYAVKVINVSKVTAKVNDTVTVTSEVTAVEKVKDGWVTTESQSEQSEPLMTTHKSPSGLSLGSPVSESETNNNYPGEGAAGDYTSKDKNLYVQWEKQHAGWISSSENAAGWHKQDGSLLVCLKRFARDFDLDIFTNLSFLLITLNTFLFCFGMSVMYTHIAAYAGSAGLGSAARDSLISSIGLSNLAGRMILGIAAQFLPLDSRVLFIGSYLLAGAGMLACAFWSSFVGLLVCVCIFGFFSAGFGPLLSEVSCRAVGVMKFSMAYGYLMIFMAAGTMLGAPIAGFLYDHTRFYQASFYLGGGCLLLAAVVMLPDLLLPRCRGKNYSSASDAEDNV